jgi:urease beta subunit
VHNRGNATAGSFAVGFKIHAWGGTQFVYPGDWFPLTAAAVGFNLPPGGSVVVKSRWRKEDIPSVGTHGCLLAVAYSPHDPPTLGANVWDDDNLAQRNLAVVNLVANESTELPLWIGSHFSTEARLHVLELRRPKAWPEVDVVLTHRRPELVEELFRSAECLLRGLPGPVIARRFTLPTAAPPEIHLGETAILRPATGSTLLLGRSSPDRPVAPALDARLVKNVEGSAAIRYEPGRRASLPVGLVPGGRRNAVLRLTAPASAQPGDRIPIDLVQRSADGNVVGGISVQVNVMKPTAREGA